MSGKIETTNMMYKAVEDNKAKTAVAYKMQGKKAYHTGFSIKMVKVFS
jgi:hypothetical protein